MGFLSDFRKDLQNAQRNKAANTKWKKISKNYLQNSKEERDRIELETGIRPQIDDTTQML